MTDDQQVQDDHGQDRARPETDGIRSDTAGTSAPGSIAGPAPAGANDPSALPPTGQGTSASGGHGVGSDRQSSGGSGEGQENAGDDAQTEWLRQEPSNPKG